jgi:hypothetical protein
MTRRADVGVNPAGHLIRTVRRTTPVDRARREEWSRAMLPSEDEAREWRQRIGQPLSWDSLAGNVGEVFEWLTNRRDSPPKASLDTWLFLLGFFSLFGEDTPHPVSGRLLLSPARGGVPGQHLPKPVMMRRFMRYLRSIDSMRDQIQGGLRVGYTADLGSSLGRAFFTLLRDPPLDERYGRRVRPSYLGPLARRVCNAPGCGRPLPTRSRSSVCSKHYPAWRKVQKAGYERDRRARMRAKRQRGAGFADPEWARATRGVSPQRP